MGQQRHERLPAFGIVAAYALGRARLLGRGGSGSLAARAWLSRGGGDVMARRLVGCALRLGAVYCGGLVDVAALAASLVCGCSISRSDFERFPAGCTTNHLGLLLTIGFPALTAALYASGRPDLGQLLPPGSVYAAASGRMESLLVDWYGWLGVAGGGLTCSAFRLGDGDLRRWYERHQGRKLLD